MSQRIVGTDGELCACFIEWQKAFEQSKWARLIHIANETDIDSV